MDNPVYCPLEVGDFVEKVSGPTKLGHRGFVKSVFVHPKGFVGIYVTGLPDKGKLPHQALPYDGWIASAFKKIPPVGDDRKVKIREKV